MDFLRTVCGGIYQNSIFPQVKETVNSMDLIERQAAIDELVRWGKIPDYNEGELNMIACTIGMLSTLPSADIREQLDNAFMHGATEEEAKYRAILDTMPQVVRCRDCKHYTGDEPDKEWYCTFWEGIRSPEAYCADGESKDEAD